MRPDCACARAERAAAEDFDPLRIRPYVVLDAPAEPEGARETRPLRETQGARGAWEARETRENAPSGAYGGPSGGAARDSSGDAARDSLGGAAGSGVFTEADPPTARLTAVRPAGGASPAPYDGGRTGDPSETVPLLPRGVGDVPPAPVERRGRGRGVLIAAVAAVAVAGTAALAAGVLGGDGTDDRAAVPDVTTSASLNVAVSEAPSPSSSSPEAPEPSTSAPTARPTSASPSPTPTPTPTESRAGASPSASATAPGTGAPSASPSSRAPVAPPVTTPTAPTTAPSPTRTRDEEPPSLSTGSYGPEVRELQRRLAAVGYYGGRVDGRYDEEVRAAVWLYQSTMYVQGDPWGVYGPNTRESLERHTPSV